MSEPTCPHTCCPYSHMRRPRISYGQCECRCHDGHCENRETFHADECSCSGDYYNWPHHYVMCPKGISMIAARKAAR